MNAPAGTQQRIGVFYVLDDCEPQAVIDDVLRYTNRDRFPPLGGFKAMAAHWHFAYTIQARANGLDWTLPFKPVLQAMGVDSAIIMDFHGDGHPRASPSGACRNCRPILPPAANSRIPVSC